MKLALAALIGAGLWAQTGENVLVVVNDSSTFSRRIGEYYVRKRAVPLANVCHIKAPIDEEISRAVYGTHVEAPVAACLAGAMTDRILYIATTLGVPLRITGGPIESGVETSTAAVDSELALVYGALRHGKPRGARFAGATTNPFFGQRDAAFTHARFPIYLVTRLAGYDFEDVKGIIDRSLVAVNRGKIVLDLDSSADKNGNNWLRAAARLLPKDRVVLDESTEVLYNQQDVIGYAAWGSNDKNRKQRRLGFKWLPGAIATEYVSSNGRTFQRPPEKWNLGTWTDRGGWFFGSPQSLTADYIHDGATGCSGHVFEPFLHTTPRPELLLPAYLSGRNLAESYYLAIPALSWQNIVVGDPLCRLARPK